LSDSGSVSPFIPEGYVSSWAQYTVQLPEGIDRAKLIEHLKLKGIPAMVYYIKPMHHQGAFEKTRSAIADCEVTERLCKTVLSLPMHPYLTAGEIRYICEAIKEFFKENR
jgi:dTDP-4-amino-4,6-dideoxygalactose transaminase